MYSLDNTTQTAPLSTYLYLFSTLSLIYLYRTYLYHTYIHAPHLHIYLTRTFHTKTQKHCRPVRYLPFYPSPCFRATTRHSIRAMVFGPRLGILSVHISQDPRATNLSGFAVAISTRPAFGVAHLSSGIKSHCARIGRIMTSSDTHPSTPD